MHTSSEQNVYIGEQVNSFTDQVVTGRFSHHVGQTLDHRNLTSRSLTLNRMLNHGLPFSETWCPPDFRQPDYVLLQPTSKKRRTSSGSVEFPRRYCTQSRNGHFSGGLSMQSSTNLSNMCEVANHHFVRSLDSRNSENVRQTNMLTNQHSLQQHWPQNELQQVTSLVSVAAVAAAAAAAATQNSTHYQQSFISPTTTVSFSEVPCSSGRNYVAIASRGRGVTPSRSGFIKRPNYRFSFSSGMGSTKRRSVFTESSETSSHSAIGSRHPCQEFTFNNKNRSLPSPSSFSSRLSSVLLCNPQLNSCPTSIIDSISLRNPHGLHTEGSIMSNSLYSENATNRIPVEYTATGEYRESVVPTAVDTDLLHRNVVEQLDIFAAHTSHPELSSQSTEHNDLLSFACTTGCNAAAIESNSNSSGNLVESVESQSQPLTYVLQSEITTSQDDQSSSTMTNKKPISACRNSLNRNQSGNFGPNCSVEENVQLSQSCFPHSELNGSAANFVVASPTSQTEEATVVAAAVVASAAAHAVAAAAQAVSAAVHHRRTSDRSGFQRFSSQSNESVLMHAMPNQPAIDPLVTYVSQSLDCSNCLANHFISPDICSHGDHSALRNERGLSYRQSQLMADLSTENVFSSFCIHPTSVCNLSSSQTMFNPSTLSSSTSTIRPGNFTCNSEINLHIPNICTGLGQFTSSSMLHPIIPAFTTSGGLTLIPNTTEFVDTYPLTTIAQVTSTTDNAIGFTMPTSGFAGPQITESHFITTPLTFSNHVESTLLGNTFTVPASAAHYQAPIYPNLTTIPTEVAAAVAVAANNSSVSQFADPSGVNFLSNIVNLSSTTCGARSTPFSPYLPPPFSSVTPIPVLPLRPPQLSIIGPPTLATTRGVNTLLQFLRLIHQRPDSYALPYYPSAMTATAGGSNQSVVVSASAGVASGTRVASAVTPPLVPHHPIAPVQSSFLSGYTEGCTAAQANLLFSNHQAPIPPSVSVQPITSAAAALAVAMAAAVALQQQNHRHGSSNSISMLTPSRAAPTPSIPVPILHAHLYYPRNVATMQQLQNNAHQQCYHSHYGGVQHQNTASQRPASMPNASINGFVPSNSVGPVFTAASGTTSPAYLTRLFPFLLAVPAPSTSNNTSAANFAVSNLSETLLAHYTDQSVGFSNGNSILSQTVSDPTSAATAAAAAAAVAAAAAAASVDTLLHLAVQLESNSGRGLNKEELDSLAVYPYVSKSLDKRIDKQKSFCDETVASEKNDPSECDRCMICLEDYEESQQIRQMRCSHEFHANCVDKWLKTKRTCPLCRADAFTGSQRKDDCL
ncbi:unnamed protein product [Heterobilharzia americana]|nr:unnamed protein product [Heterobilharzia americana]